MPTSPRPQAGHGRRRHSSGLAACELRAAVTESCYDWMEAQAEELGRPRSWHVGLVVEAYAATAQQMTALELAHLDALLRSPAQLLTVLRTGMQSISSVK